MFQNTERGRVRLRLRTPLALIGRSMPRASSRFASSLACGWREIHMGRRREPTASALPQSGRQPSTAGRRSAAPRAGDHRRPPASRASPGLCGSALGVGERHGSRPHRRRDDTIRNTITLWLIPEARHRSRPDTRAHWKCQRSVISGWLQRGQEAKRSASTIGKWCPGAESNHRHCDFQSLDKVGCRVPGR